MSPAGLRHAYIRGTDLLDKGVSAAEVRQQLRAAGLDKKAAESVVGDLEELSPAKRRLTNLTTRAEQLAHFAAHRAAARVNIFLGAIIFGAGVLVTVGSLLWALTSRTGIGSFVLAWGAIIYGGYRLLLGLSQVSKKE
jgi:hypothetical protein